ncbi:serine hydrolase-like protein [Corythoichthys intestinalis]|uniref:serine hydrolase-like protein n=1 Tax=Corythoichthys intestinalis TaxID=161448 RepID=UPI0025A5AEE2|nr:serine hydrolase-like protein [Corythoichthys intestinalis]XP_061792497.1 serine hydrolase-like protein [Nerophis lumbriciformis]
MIRMLKNVRNLSTASMKQTELSVPVPWGEIRGKVWGPDHGRPVLCLHGWADNCGTFNTLIPLLPKECRYVAVDLAGHGLSSHRPPGVFYTFTSYVADIQRVVETLHWRRFSILGHSMGGNIAGMFSALFPEMVEACVMLDSYGFLPTDPNEMSKIMRQGMDDMLKFEKNPAKSERVYTYEKAVERLLAANPTLSEASASNLLERGLVKVEGGVVFSRDFRINLKNIARISLEQSLVMLSRIQASVLLVLADDGFQKIFAEPDQRKFASELLQGYRQNHHTVERVPGGHHVHLNNPEVVAPVVSEFLHRKVLSSTVRADGLTTKL